MKEHLIRLRKRKEEYLQKMLKEFDKHILIINIIKEDINELTEKIGDGDTFPKYL